MNRLTITIPGKLDPILTPNRGQRNPHGKSKARSRAKSDAFLYGKQAAYGVNVTGIDRATYHIELGKAKGEQSKDQDGLIAACKGHLDGIALALDVDDRHWHPGTVTQVRDPEQIGYLKITLEWDAATEEDAA